MGESLHQARQDGDTGVGMTVELIYFEGCPHAEHARDRLRTALKTVHLPLEWVEWDTEKETTPARYRRYASPTVLVNGVDVTGRSGVSGAGCALGGGPNVDQLLVALRAGMSS